MILEDNIKKFENQIDLAKQDNRYIDPQTQRLLNWVIYVHREIFEDTQR